MFELAAKYKYRFTSSKGQISVEDLWDLSVEQLDAIYQGLDAENQQAQRKSLLKVSTLESLELKTKIEIVEHIVHKKQEEAANRLERAEKRKRNARIRELLASRQDKALDDKSDAELQALLDDE